MKKPLNKYHLIGLDTNIFVYYFNRNSPFYSSVNQVIEKIIIGKSHITTSILTLTELLSFNTSTTIINKLEDALFLMPNITILEVNRGIAKYAAEIRREYGFRLPDAIQLATAKHAKVEIFITNDQKLKKFRPLKVLLVTDIIL